MLINQWLKLDFKIFLNISYTKLSFLDEKIRNESSKRGSTSSAASISSNAAVPTAAEICNHKQKILKLQVSKPWQSYFKLLILQSYKITFLTAARHATKTPSLATLADSHLQSSTSLLKPCSLTTSCAKTGSLHNLCVIKQSY